MSEIPESGGLRLARIAVARGRRVLLREVSLSLEPGQLWLLCGPNGAGKSTLLEVAAGILAPAAGRRSLDGRPLERWPRRERARRIGLLPQDEAAGYEGRVGEFVALGRLPWEARAGGWAGPRAGHAADPVVREELLAFGLDSLVDARLRELSAGQRQRARLAQLFAQRAGVLLLDEPATYLDLGSQALLRRRLERHCLERRGAALVVVHPSGWPMPAGQRLALAMPDGALAVGEARTMREAGLVEQSLGCRLERFDSGEREVWLPA